MNQQLLIAHRWKTLGWILTIPSLIGGIYYLSIDGGDYLKIALPEWLGNFMWIDNGFIASDTSTLQIAILDEIICLVLFSGLLLLGFSREKVEDEWIQRVRLESFQWAILVNTLLLMLFVIFAHGFPFLNVMVYNMFTPLLIFVGRYYYVLRLKPLFSKD